MNGVTGLRIRVRGIVQGVGFRPWVYRLAQATGITGRVLNGATGVTIDAFGTTDEVNGFVRRLRTEPPPTARIDTFETSELEGARPDAFHIDMSSDTGTRQLTIGPDLSTCPACLEEVGDPRDRRHRYAFTNCTGCGPRLTITEDVPYDRAKTTMSAFPMCPDCAREYATVSDRRFHAEPNACPRCGPRLSWRDSSGAPLDVDAIHAAAEALRDGAVLLIKGLGGYHLACDATSQDAVTRLRERKRREEKPFAIMVGDVGDAEALAWVTSAERKLLTSIERPIVLMQRREPSVAQAVAPDAARLGIMLPYTPLHHLLLAEAGRPLVMTSANLSDEPTVHRDEDATALLGSVADYALDHDRRISLRVDDSVATVIAGAPVLLRRSRGFTPRPILLREPVPEPVLACGAQLKNTFCIAVGDRAYLGPHIGDLDSLASFDSFADTVARFESMLGVTPTLVAHDLHPDLASTRYARARPGRHLAVQHHHAHIASVMAEHGLNDSVIGIAYDGTGLGPDGTAWGGEVLLARRDGYERLACLRRLPLPGGERAIREPWRLALALLEDALGDAIPFTRLPLFCGITEQRRLQVLAILRDGAHAPSAHGAGRYFDAVASLVLERPTASYEAQLAMALEQIADPHETRPYEFDVEAIDGRQEIDLRPTTRALVRDLLAAESPATVAARFHHTLVAATAQVVKDLPSALPVALSGGCFQNAILTAGLVAALPERRVLLPEEAPPNDGGIALGQVWVATATSHVGKGIS